MQKNYEYVLLEGAEFEFVGTGFGDQTSMTSEIKVEDSDEAIIIECDQVPIGTYILREVEAPGGYNPLEGDVSIELTDSDHITVKIGDTQITDPTYVYKDSNGVWTVKLMNSAGVVLPHTGGIGTGFFYITGLALMAFAGVFLWWKRKRVS